MWQEIDTNNIITFMNTKLHYFVLRKRKCFEFKVHNISEDLYKRKFNP